MDEDRADALFARYIEHLVVEGVHLPVEQLAEGEADLKAALEARIAAFRKIDRVLTRAHEPLTGRTLGRYEVLESLGAGGMGVVYRAQDSQLGRQVALKVLPTLFALEAQRRARFEREARILAALDHPHVATIHGIERTDELSFLVLELVPGDTLGERIARRPLRLGEALPLFHQIASALEAAHAKGIVHRDLKPANIKITPEGDAKVVDFGLGKTCITQDSSLLSLPTPSEATAETRTGMILGTPAYMSPEQARGREVDRRSDIWSFGCVLYEALTGVAPFRGESFSDTVAAILGREPDWKALPKRTPAQLRNLLRHCLEKDPEQRLGDIGEGRILLERLLARRAGDRRGARRSERTVQQRLPAPLTVFLGREEEIAEIQACLRDPACRLLTLVGPGGIGKTRLALEAARRLPLTFTDGVCFVSLSSLGSRPLLFSALGDALGLTLTDSGDPQALVLGLLRERELLFVLDSFEHLANEAEALVEILTAAPRVKLLVTSRVTLGVPEGWIREVAGLPWPPEDLGSSSEASGYPAVQLFLESARRLRSQPLDEALPDIVRICRRVEGMPLAIELAAASLRQRTCREIASALEASLDLLARPSAPFDDRHRSVRACFEHSWRLLAPQERQLFERLSLFRGGFRRQAAEEIAGADAAGLSALLRSSFVSWDEGRGRFVIHDLLRQLGEEKLRQDGEAFEAVRRRFCRFFARLLRDDLELGKDIEALDVIAKEIDNVRAAWNYAVQAQDVETLDQALDGLWAFYELRGWIREGETALGTAARMLESVPHEPSAELARLTVRTLRHHAWFLHRLGRLSRSRAQIEKACSRIPTDAPWSTGELALVKVQLAMIFMIRGGFESARSLTEDALAISEKHGDRAHPYTRPILGFTLLFLGAYDELEGLCRAGLAAASEAGDERGCANYLDLLAAVSSARGNQTEARRLLEQSLEKVRRLGDQIGYYFVYDLMGQVAFACGDYAEAARCHVRSLKSASRMAVLWCEAEGRSHLGHALVALGKDEAAAQLFEKALSSATEMQAAPVVLDAVSGLASLAASADTRAASHLLCLVRDHPAAKASTKARACELMDRFQGPRRTTRKRQAAPAVSIRRLESLVAALPVPAARTSESA